MEFPTPPLLYITIGILCWLWETIACWYKKAGLLHENQLYELRNLLSSSCLVPLKMSISNYRGNLTRFHEKDRFCSKNDYWTLLLIESVLLYLWRVCYWYKICALLLRLPFRSSVRCFCCYLWGFWRLQLCGAALKRIYRDNESQAWTCCWPQKRWFGLCGTHRGKDRIIKRRNLRFCLDAVILLVLRIKCSTRASLGKRG